MGLIDFIFRKFSKNNKLARLPGPNTYSVDVVGESHYQSALELICGGRTEESQQKIVNAVLVHEDNNAHDSNAVRIDINGMTVGYLSRSNAKEYRKILEEAGYKGINASCSAMIVGGWDRGRGDRGHFGIRLDLPTD